MTIIIKLQNISGKFIYYARIEDPTIMMSLHSLSVVHTKASIETAKQVTQFLNYSATHPDTVT